MILLGLINIILIQWLFFRIAKEWDTDNGKTLSYGILFPVIPLTGWKSKYIPNNPKYYRVFNN